MCVVLTVSTDVRAGAKARWLADLDQALADARQLMKRLGAAEGRLEAIQLYTRIEALRLEVESLRLGRRTPGVELPPQWMELLPWQQRPGGS